MAGLYRRGHIRIANPSVAKKFLRCALEHGSILQCACYSSAPVVSGRLRSEVRRIHHGPMADTRALTPASSGGGQWRVVPGECGKFISCTPVKLGRWWCGLGTDPARNSGTDDFSVSVP
jgi:hypothetical protein